MSVWLVEKSLHCRVGSDPDGTYSGFVIMFYSLSTGTDLHLKYIKFPKFKISWKKKDKSFNKLP
jgi:hypothetical protein